MEHSIFFIGGIQEDGSQRGSAVVVKVLEQLGMVGRHVLIAGVQESQTNHIKRADSR